jgi:two-component system heavy metal sensor histidine kinase CusS
VTTPAGQSAPGANLRGADLRQSTAGPDSEAAHASPRWSWSSLTIRLGAWFALLAALLLAVVGVMLCHTLEAELLARDAAELSAKSTQLGEALRDFESVAALKARQNDFFGAVYDTARQAIVVADASGTPVIASRMLMVPDDLLRSFAREPNRAPQIVDWNRDGDDWHAVLAWGTLGQHSIATHAAAPMVLVVALNRSSTNLMLDQFYRRLALMLVGGGLVTAAIGFGVAYHGLAPLRVVDRTASAITAERLDARLDLARAPDEVRRLGASFNAMLARLADSFRRLSEFSSDLAHELRTPLNNLLGATHVALSRPRTPAEYQEVLESNAEELERLRRMTEDMLFLAKADERETRLDRQRFAAREEIDKVAEYFTVVADEKAVRFAIEGDAAPVADRRLVQRALNNLFGNAVRHATPGTAIEVRVTADADGTVAIAVTNSGPGIAPEHLPRVFDRFYRADASRPDSAESSGLGLAIVRSIMQMHGGAATAASASGRTTFTLRFPGR